MNQSVQMSEKPQEIERVFESDPDQCAEIVRELMSVLTAAGWSKDDRFAIRMAIE